MTPVHLLTFWGKARPEVESEASWRPLVRHCLDVAASGLAMVDLRGLPQGRASVLGDHWPGVLGALLALHDVGKLSRPFLAQHPEHWPEAVLGPCKPQPAKLRHDSLGYAPLA